MGERERKKGWSNRLWIDIVRIVAEKSKHEATQPHTEKHLFILRKMEPYNKMHAGVCDM